MDNYSAPDPQLWQARVDLQSNSLRLHQVIQCLDLSRAEPSIDKHKLKIALLGFACDEGIRRNQGRIGAQLGPNAIREKLAGLCVHFEPEELSITDMGNINFLPSMTSNSLIDPLSISQNCLSAIVAQLLYSNYFPIVMGGGHELALGHFMGLYQHIQKTPGRSSKGLHKLGIINLDAHFDLRCPKDGQANSGTPFWQIAENIGSENFDYLCLGTQKFANTQALYQTAQQLSVQYIEAQAFYSSSSETYAEIQYRIKQFIQARDFIYLTICLDAFASSYAPGVSAPNISGLVPQMVFPYLQTIMQSAKLIAFDVAELSPPHDYDAQTARLAAWLIWEIIQQLAQNTDSLMEKSK